MRLLDRYLLRELLIPLFFCLSGFLIFVIAFSLFAELNRYQENKLNVGDVLDLYAARIPGDLVLVMPVALLLALLYALTNHARHNELTAIRAAGVSLLRLCQPYLMVGLFLSAAVFYLSENWVPHSAEREERIMTRHQAKVAGSPSEDVKEGLIFDNARDHRLWHFDRYNLKSETGGKPKVQWIMADGTRRLLVADYVQRTNDVWIFFTNVHLYEIATNANARQEQILVTNVVVMPEFTETPEQIRREVRFTSYFRNLASQSPDIPIAAIADYLDLHPRLGGKEGRWLRTNLQSRLAAPWTCLVVVIVAIPFGAASGRRNLFVGVASSIVIVFAYFVMMKIGTGLGTAGFLPPVVAAWLPNICFSVMGLVMMQRVR